LLHDLRHDDAARYSSLDGYAQDLLDVCHALDLHDVIVVAHSVSGMISVLAANREPERFAQLRDAIPEITDRMLSERLGRWSFWVMLIGFNLAPVVANIYWPQDQWVALLTMAFVLICSLVLRGFWARISILLGLIFGYLISWVFDKAFGQIHSITGSSGGKPLDHFRTDFSGVDKASLVGLPHFTAPHVGVNFSLLVLPAV